MQNNKVIAITLYRRPKYTGILFDALRECYGINDYDIIIGHDFSDEHEVACSKVSKLIDGIDFGQSVQVIRNNPPQGTDLNKLAILPIGFSLSDYVVFLEDDTIPSPDALRYFEWGNRQFANDPNILSICGYNRILFGKAWQLDTHAYFTKKGFCPWSWGMWRDRYESFVGTDGKKYTENVDDVNGRFDWHLNWATGDMHSVYPVLARTQSIGGEDASHTPSPEWHYENEYNETWARQVDLYDRMDDTTFHVVE